MGDPSEYLYDPAKCESWEVRFPEGYLPGNERFAVKNLILRNQRPHEVRSAQGFEQWIFFQFYSSTLRGRDALGRGQLTPVNAFEIIAPNSPVFHGRNTPWMRSLMSLQGNSIESVFQS